MSRNSFVFTVAGCALCCAVATQAQQPEERSNQRVSEPQRIENQRLETVTVYGRQAGDTVADIPQSVSVFDRKQIDLTAAVNVGDIVQYVPTASRNGSTLNAFGDDYLIRGFGANQIVNGLGFNRLAHARDLANVERVEVLKGPAAVLYGQMEPGAVINVVTKQPLDYFHAEMGIELGSYDSQRYTADITGPLAEKVKGRLNVAYSDSETFIDFWDKQRLFVAPNLTVDFSSATQLVIEGTYTETDWGSFQNGRPASGSFLPNPNGKYDEDFNPDEPDIGFTERDSADINLRLTHEINDNLTARASYTYTRNERAFKEMFVIGLREDQRTIDRAIFVGGDGSDNDRNLLLDLTGEIATGPLLHKFIAGYNRRTFDSINPTRFVLTTPLDIFDPVYGQAPDVDPDLNRFYQHYLSDEAFFQDRIALGERFNLLVGVRYTDSEQDTKSATAAGDTTRDQLDETNWTTQLGVLYDITESASVYANRSEAFAPQFGSSSTGRPFDAEESVQYEIGSRVALGDSGLEANVAFFSITKENLTTTDPDNPQFEAALGEVESRGVEVSVTGYLMPNWFAGLAYGYTDTKILKNFDGLDGNALRNVPENTASLQTRYDITEGILNGLGLGANVVYVDDRYGDDENSFELPAYTRVDLGLYYTVNESFDIDLLFNNVTDEDIYVEGYSLEQVVQEPGRTFLTRLTLRF